MTCGRAVEHRLPMREYAGSNPAGDPFCLFCKSYFDTIYGLFSDIQSIILSFVFICCVLV